MAKRRKKKKIASNNRLRAIKDFVVDIDWAMIGRTSRGVMWLIAMAGLVAAWIIGVPRLQAFAVDSTNVQSLTVRFVQTPAWVTDDLQTMLNFTAAQHITGNPFARDDLVHARKALLSTGWFTDIVQLRRVRADLVEVNATFVTPFAVVSDDDFEYLIDPTGRLLPKSGRARQDAGFLTIINARHHAPNHAGEPWAGEDITAALKLIRLITARAWKTQITQIDLNRYRRDGMLIMHTDGDCRIVWGSPPGEEAALELLADGKLLRLDYLYDNYQRVDAGLTGELDVTDPKATIRRE